MHSRLTAILFFALLAANVRAAEPITCAILPDLTMSRSPVTSMLAVELTQKPELAPVERAQINKILAEQKLHFAMGAADIDSRRRIGQLLHANLIVQLRSGTRTINGSSQQVIECVISESEHGLRLVRDIHALNPNSIQEEARVLSGDIDRATAKLREQIRWIFAVPPFQSQDLAHRYDHMQRSLAEALIGRLAAQPGVQVVEIEEARALANEARLTGANPTVRPLLAFFINGKYRNEGTGPARRITIDLDVTQADRTLDSRQGSALDPGAIPEFLASTLGQFVAKATGSQPAAFDVKRECAAMEKRAAEFEGIGEWENAFTLLETSLMLQPNRPQIDRRIAAVGAGAVKSLARSIQIVENPEYKQAFEQLRTGAQGLDAQAYQKAVKAVRNPTITKYTDYQNKGSYEAALAGAYALYLRGLDHYAAYLRTTDYSTGSPAGNRTSVYARPDYGADALLEWNFAVQTADFYIPSSGPASALKETARNERLRVVIEWLEGLSDAQLPRAKAFLASRPARLDHMDSQISYQPILAMTSDRDMQLRLIKLCLRDGTAQELASIVVWHMDAGDYESFLARVEELGPEGKYIAAFGRIKKLETKSSLDAWTKFAAELEKDRDVAPPRLAQWRLCVMEQIDIARSETQQAGARPQHPEKPSVRTRTIGNGNGRVQSVDLVDTSTLPAPPPKIADPDIEFIPLSIYKDPLLSGAEFKYIAHGTQTERVPIPWPIRGWIDCGNGVEVLWTNRNIIAMRAKDKLESLMQFKPRTDYRDPVFDGKHVWLYDNEGLKAIDPATGEIQPIKFGPEVPPSDLYLAPIGLGQLLIVGYSDRTWVGILDDMGSGKYKLDVIHEARIVSGNPNDPGLVFRPRQLKRIEGAAGGSFTIMIERDLPGRAGQFPLIFDPLRRSVSIARNPIDLEQGGTNPTYRIGRYAVQMDIVTMNPDPCTLLDEAGRKVKLKGRLPAWVTPTVIANSHYYGPIVLTTTEMNTPNAWQIVMRHKPEDLLAHAEAPTPAPRPNIPPRLTQSAALAGHTVVLRAYPPDSTGGNAFGKIEAVARANGVEIEANQAADGSFLLLYAEDQTDPFIRDWTGNRFGIWIMAHGRGGSDAPALIPMNGRNIPGSSFALQDCESRPIANATIAEVFYVGDPRQKEPQVFRAMAGKTDANGTIPARMGGGGMTGRVLFKSFEVTDPGIGTLGFKATGSGAPLTLPVSMTAGDGDLKARLVDSAGAPLAGVEVHLEDVLMPDGTVERFTMKRNLAGGREQIVPGSAFVYCVTLADGGFRMTLPRGNGLKVPAGAKYRISIQCMNMPVLTAVVSNDQQQTVTVGKPLDCTIAARNESGQTLKYEEFRDSWLLREFDGFQNPNSMTPPLGSTLSWQEPQQRLWPGRYRLMGGNYESTNAVEVTSSGPAELLFTVKKATPH